ncbi:MAG: hypothetical protein IJZ46_00315 [Bacilli bacterium]|nr:hypothetical protein [Bacilli bacterium]
MSEEKNSQKENKINLREMWKDKKGKAKIQLCLYGIFFIGVLIFSKVLGSYNAKIEENNPVNNSFVVQISDNYEYNIEININNNIYKYYGKTLGNNQTITREVETEINNYYVMIDKYYILDDSDNYILTTKEEIYPYIDYRYLNINNIREFIKISTVENNIYKVKLSDLILNYSGEEYITINIDELNRCLEIDYTNLFKANDTTINKSIVKITYTNINKITSLEE